MKAKSVSLWVIILSGVWVAVLALAKAMFPAVTGSEIGLGVPEIIATGVFFVIIFTPVYRSIWLDKQLGAKMEEAKLETLLQTLRLEYDELMKSYKRLSREKSLWKGTAAILAVTTVGMGLWIALSR